MELKISFASSDMLGVADVKRRVIDFIEAMGRTDIVEGYIDGIDISLSEDEMELATTTDERMNAAPLLIFDDHRPALEEIVRSLDRDFQGFIIAEISEISEESWQRCWNHDFSPLDTKNFFIVPLGHGAATPTGLERVEIDAGEGAFGTGQHATTRAIIRLLEEQLPGWSPKSLLDVGTGTGIYLILAKKMGVNLVVGTEISDELSQLARANCEISGVDAHIVVSDKIMFERKFDLIVANILAPVLHEIMPQMSEHMAENGRIVIAGFVEKEQQLLLKRASEFGLELCYMVDEKGWRALVLKK